MPHAQAYMFSPLGCDFVAQRHAPLHAINKQYKKINSQAIIMLPHIISHCDNGARLCLNRTEDPCQKRAEELFAR